MLTNRPVGRAQPRYRGLERGWRRILGAMLAVFGLLVIGTFVLHERSIGLYRNAADELITEATFASGIEQAMAQHEAQAHAWLAGEPGDAQAFNAQVSAITKDFQRGLTLLTDPQEQSVLRQAEASWRSTLVEWGIWVAPQGERSAIPTDGQGEFAREANQAASAVEGLTTTTRHIVQTELNSADQFQLAVVILLGLLFALALAVAIMVARHLRRDVLRPIRELQRGVVEIENGHLDHKIELPASRHPNDLHALAAAFNTMAGALDGTHRDLRHQATHDPLTGLPNRSGLMLHLEDTTERGKRRNGPGQAVLFIDVDDFKLVNDSLGHATGDVLLQRVAERLAAAVRPSDFVARLGGDEFAVVISDLDPLGVAETVAGRIIETMSRPFHLEGTSHTVSVSVGISERQMGAGDPLGIVAHADFAMYMAKGLGKARYECFDPFVLQATLDKAEIRAALHDVVEHGGLELEFQPVLDLTSGGVAGVEALVRWRHPQRGLLPPSEFIPLAEDTGAIVPIGQWVLKTAITHLEQWQRSGSWSGGMWLSVNVSPVQLRSQHAVEDMVAALRSTPTAGQIVVEITETGLLTNNDSALRRLKLLQSTGARIALDDFGTGYSSLGMLQKLPIAMLKIDRSIVSEMADGAPNATLDAIVGLARTLHLDVIAEGIEQVGQVDGLRELRCRFGQGFAFARPMPARAFLDFMQSSDVVSRLA